MQIAFIPVNIGTKNAGQSIIQLGPNGQQQLKQFTLASGGNNFVMSQPTTTQAVQAQQFKLEPNITPNLIQLQPAQPQLPQQQLQPQQPVQIAPQTQPKQPTQQRIKFGMFCYYLLYLR